MTVPVIDGIDKDTFEYRPVYHGRQHFRGIFEWGMLYKEIEIPDEEIKRRKYHSEPYKWVQGLKENYKGPPKQNLGATVNSSSYYPLLDFQDDLFLCLVFENEEKGG